jgi:aspartate racemase
VIFDELTRASCATSHARRTPTSWPVWHDQGAEAVGARLHEIELLVRPEDAPLPVLESMRTHAEAAVAVALGDRVLVER